VLKEALREALDEIDLDLGNFIAPRVMERGGNIFELLIAIILSQNTNDRNAWRAYLNLVERLGSITPENLAGVDVGTLASLIRPAGMHLVRARRIAELSKRVKLEDLERLREMGVEEARRYLTSLPGVGKKTADVLLLYLGKPVFPVDTHISRIAMRLGLADRRDYDTISERLKAMFDPSQYLVAHLKLIELGRRICRSRNPRCNICRLRVACNYGGRLRVSEAEVKVRRQLFRGGRIRETTQRRRA